MKFSENISINEVFTPIDWAIFFAILIITIGFVAYSYFLEKKSTAKKNGAVEYILMGRQLTLPFFVATLVSTWYGGILGVTQISFNYGIYNFITQGLFWYLSYFVFAFFLVKKIRKYKAITLPELVQKIFGPHSSKLSSIFLFFNVLPITYVISLAILLQFLFGFTFVTSAAVGTAFVVLYSIFGGFKAVVRSDMVQFITMCLGVLSVVVFSFSQFGGYSFLLENLPESHFSFTGGLSLSSTFVWFFIACAVTFINPTFYQRCFAAKSDKTAIWGILISIVIWMLFDCCTTLGGMYARAVIPEADSLNAYMIYSLQLLPPGFRGFLIAGMAATILSTLDSFLFISSTTLSYDFVKNKSQKSSLEHIVSLVITSTITLVIAVQFGGNLEKIWRVMESYFTSCLLVPLLWGYIMPNKFSDKEFVTSCLGGVIGTSAWLYFDLGKIYNLDSFYVGIIISSSILTVFLCLQYLSNLRIIKTKPNESYL